jgi:hypothetical protein
MSAFVTKQVFLEALQCPRRAWRLHREPREAADPLEPEYERLFRTWQGNDIHTRARAFLGEGAVLRSGEITASVAATQAALGDGTLPIVFEATATAHRCVARADALRRVGAGWELIEVKSAKTPEDGKPQKDYVDDLAYTMMVAEGAGLTITSATLVLINRDYRLELDGTVPLFGTVDATSLVRKRAKEFAAFADAISTAVLGADEPAAVLTIACRGCEHFGTDCLGAGIPDPLFDLPRLSAKKLDELGPYGRISNIPRNADLTDNQRRVAEAVWSGQPVIDAPTLGKLDGVAYPLLFLDFESISTAIPVFAGTPPHQQVAFQYSLHVQRAPGATLEHLYYLAETGADWRRSLAEQLIADLGPAGTIFSYSPFESQILRGIAEMLPDLAGACEALIARIVDLEPVVRLGWVHPAFRGRSSIKKVLPVVDPSLTYDTLSIGEGGAASSAFALMHAGRLAPHAHAGIRAALLTYCEQDTIAMVKVYEALRSLR